MVVNASTSTTSVNAGETIVDGDWAAGVAGSGKGTTCRISASCPVPFIPSNTNPIQRTSHTTMLVHAPIKVADQELHEARLHQPSAVLVSLSSMDTNVVVEGHRAGERSRCAE